MLTIVLFITACKTEKKQDLTSQSDVKNTVEQEEAFDATHAADAAASIVTWKGFKPTGSHHGTIPIKSGGVVYQDGQLQKGEFVLNLAELTVDDIPADDDMHGKLVKHLKSEDFFDTNTYPEAVFVFGRVEDGKLLGRLTLKNKVKPLSIPFTVSEADGVLTLKAEAFKLDRTDYGIRYKSKKFFDNLKDKFIDDEFEVSFEVKLK